MRVVHVDPERGWGGGEVQVLGLLRRQARAGLDVVLAADPSGRIGARAAEAGIATVPLRIRNHADAWAGLQLRRLVRGADVVHFHTARAHALAPCLVGTSTWRVVTRRMDYVPRGGPYVRVLYGRFVDAVIAISEGVRQSLVRAGVDGTRIVVVPSGVDPERVAAGPGAREAERARLGVAGDAVLVVGLGALERRKGFDVLVEALALRPHPAVRIVLAGAGSEAARLARLADARGVAVVCLGFQEHVGSLLAAADVVAVPSRAEGLGVAALEAMAAGRAVVASRVGGLAEVVGHGETGLLVPPDDPGALADAIACLADDPALRSDLGMAGRRLVERRFSLDAMAAGTFACYGRAP